LPATPLFPRKGVLAAAVIDVAMHTQGQPISAKTLAARRGSPPGISNRFVANAEHEFGVALARINVDDMARDAQALNKSGGRGAART
jgi:hypothetical protein